MDNKDSNKDELSKLSSRVGRNYTPTADQINLIVATLLTDGWIEIQKNGINPRIGLQQSKQEILLKWQAELKGCFTLIARPVSVDKSPPGSVKAFRQWVIRTTVNPHFHLLLNAFGLKDSNKMTPRPKKDVPPFYFLMEHLDYKGLAWMLMFDGSRKSDHGRGMELHLQGFEYEGQRRLCIALYKKLGIKCFPSLYKKGESGNLDQYHVQISGYSLDLIKEKVEPFFLDDYKYKIPAKGFKFTEMDFQSPWTNFYKSFKDLPEFNHPLANFK